MVKDGKSFGSETQHISLGIPQGSTIGPFLFLIYINDIENVVSSENQVMVNFADDTNLLVRGQTYPDVLAEIGNLMEATERYFFMNRLKINADKTNCILFKKVQDQLTTPASAKINQNRINFTSATKFLGLHIDEHLDWCVHTDFLCSKLNGVAYSLRVLKNYLDKSTLMVVYFSNFQSLLRYGIIFWGRSKNIKNIFVTQKRTVRIINNKKSDMSCRGLFKSSKILTVTGLYIRTTDFYV